MQVVWPMQFKNQIQSKIQLSHIANIKSLTVNHKQFDFLQTSKSIDQQKSELKNTGVWKYNLKTLETGNFIFDSGVITSPNGTDKAVVFDANSREFSNIKVRPTQRKYMDDFLSVKTPQA